MFKLIVVSLTVLPVFITPHRSKFVPFAVGSFMTLIFLRDLIFVGKDMSGLVLHYRGAADKQS